MQEQMGRGGKVGWKHSKRRRVRSKDKGSDDSDEDYMVEEDEVSDSEQSSFEGDELEENFDSFEEDEDEEEEEEVRKVIRSKPKMGSLGRRKFGGQMPPKRKRVSYEEDDEEYDEDYDEDYDDEEFTPEEVDGVDEEEEFLVKKKNNKKVGQRAVRKKASVKTQKGKRKVMKKPLRKKGKRSFGSRRKAKLDDDDDDDDDEEFIGKNAVVGEKSKKKPGQRKRRLVVQSDSDFMSSASDFEFTISEEEREQVREAGKLCRNLMTSLRSSSSSKRIQEDVDLGEQRKHLERKGKEKVEDIKNEVVKQVCGICLSEEGKRIVRGTLNCCSHYFCFVCIMEWSKVESRCPLCKQRFVTISKPAKLNTGIDLRDVVIQVPERDQVYQPSEEEIRGYLDPYENVICTECHQGGDDNLMLLCDLCDSPAHTYCVGLGREVPEGNWYCEGCRPVALGSSNSQVQDLLSDQRTASNNFSHRPSPLGNLREDLDPTLVSFPSTPFTQGFGILPSPRYPDGDVQAASPMPGVGASTLSGRRRIRLQIHNRMRQMAGRTDGISAANLGSDYFSSQVDQSRATTFQHSRTPETGTSYYNFFEERVQDNPSSVQNGDLFPARASHLRRQVVQDPTPTTTDGYVHGALWSGINSISGYEQLRECSSRSSIGSDGSVSPCTLGEGSHFYIEKQRVQLLVRNHLKSLSRDFDLGHNSFKDIARKSTHTILATCGLEHRSSEVHPMQQPPSICSHVETMVDVQMSLMKGHCSSCFESFARNVVKTIMNARLPHWLQFRD